MTKTKIDPQRAQFARFLAKLQDQAGMSDNALGRDGGGSASMTLRVKRGLRPLPPDLVPVWAERLGLTTEREFVRFAVVAMVAKLAPEVREVFEGLGRGRAGKQHGAAVRRRVVQETLAQLAKLPLGQVGGTERVGRQAG